MPASAVCLSWAACVNAAATAVCLSWTACVAAATTAVSSRSRPGFHVLLSLSYHRLRSVRGCRLDRTLILGLTSYESQHYPHSLQECEHSENGSHNLFLCTCSHLDAVQPGS